MPPIIVTPDLANRLWHATCDLMHEFTFDANASTVPFLDDLRNRLTDDTGDDWTAIVTLMSIMHRFNEDGEWNIAYMTRWLNAPEGETVPHTAPDGTEYRNIPRIEALRDVGGCDGIPQAFYDLDCPALPDA